MGRKWQRARWLLLPQFAGATTAITNYQKLVIEVAAH
jgi:hypothetical protein